MPLTAVFENSSNGHRESIGYVLPQIGVLLFLVLLVLLWLSPRSRHKKQSHHAPKKRHHPIEIERESHIKGRYTLHVVGEQYENRERVIAKLSEGDLIVLYREPNNSYDPNAVAVLTAQHEKIGFLARHNAEWVARIMDEGYTLKASVACLFVERGFKNVQIYIDNVPTGDESKRKYRDKP